MATIMQGVLEKELQSNTDRFGIYRLQNTEENRYYAFCSLEALQAIQITPKKEMYSLIYVDKLNKATNLEKLFEIFNLEHPKDFLCASLSVGDIIAIHKEGKLKAYYVDPVGFSELTDFFGETEPLTSKCPICGSSPKPGEKLCGRCLLLQDLLGEYPTMEGISVVFWDHCFACESEIIASVSLTPNNLVVQCDNCGEIHTIPFQREDILGNPAFYLPLCRDSLNLLRLMAYPFWQESLIQEIVRTVFPSLEKYRWCLEHDGYTVYILAALNLPQLDLAMRMIQGGSGKRVRIICLDWQEPLFRHLLEPFAGQRDLWLTKLPAGFLEGLLIKLKKNWGNANGIT